MSVAELAPSKAPALSLSNTLAIGQVLYTQYFYFFQAAGFVLLTAMIGAITLTLQHKPNVKRQNVAEQNARDRHAAVTMRKVDSGKGL
jgi:NADH-quinone oxidoreductase subunit J